MRRRRDGGSPVFAQPGDGTRTDGVIVAGGWDHEHCEICWGKIGSGGEAEVYVNTLGQWVCLRCHARHIEARDLSCVTEGANDDGVKSDEEEAYDRMARLIDEYDLARSEFRTLSNRVML